MRKALSIIFTLFSLAAFGQANYGFVDGMIITKQNDTIKCQVEVNVNYGMEIKYKKNTEIEESVIPTKKVKALVTPFTSRENIVIGKRELFMSILVDGKIKLYNHVVMNTGASSPSNGGTISMYSAPTIIYAIKKDDAYIEVKRKNFKEVVNQKFVDCQTIIDKVNNKEYKFEDLEKIVKEYNTCNQ